MVGANFIHRFRMNGGVCRGEFREAVQKSGRGRAEGNRCVGDLLSDVLIWEDNTVAIIHTY